MKKVFIALALLLAVCGVESRAATLYFSCTVEITSGENYAECEGGSVSTDETKVYVKPLNRNFIVKSVIWTHEGGW